MKTNIAQKWKHNHVPARISKFGPGCLQNITSIIKLRCSRATFLLSHSADSRITVFNVEHPIMFKYVVRAAPRRILPPRTVINSAGRRFLSTAPPTQKSRSWKSSAARWALAAGGIYYYNTSNVFAEEPEGKAEQVGLFGSREC